MYRSALSSRVHSKHNIIDLCIPFFTKNHCNTSAVRCYSKNVSREARFMGKILSKSVPKKKLKFYHAAPEARNPVSMKCSNKVNSRRITVLNKLFMEHISDLMATNTWHPNFNSDGFEITRVAINSDFHSLNVFWYSQSISENFEPILSDIAHKIHHELSQLQLMGNVPKITFVRDTNKEKLLEVDNLLLSLSSTDKLLINDGNNNEIEDNHQMAMNIYGLEHDKIMKKLGFGQSSKGTKKRKEENSETDDDRQT